MIIRHGNGAQESARLLGFQKMLTLAEARQPFLPKVYQTAWHVVSVQLTAWSGPHVWPDSAETSSACRGTVICLLGCEIVVRGGCPGKLGKALEPQTKFQILCMQLLG